LPYFDLAKPPQRNYRKAKDYKGDTSGWVLWLFNSQSIGRGGSKLS
jgi:hypothetical protein